MSIDDVLNIFACFPYSENQDAVMGRFEAQSTDLVNHWLGICTDGLLHAGSVNRFGGAWDR